MSVDPLSLPWLPPPPADFRQQLKAMRAAGGLEERQAIALARHTLNLSQLGQLSKLIGTSVEALGASGGLRPIKLTIAASHTVEFVAEAIPATGLRHGLMVTVESAAFGLAAQRLLDPQSALAITQPDYVLLSFDHHALGLARPVLSDVVAEEAVEAALGQAATLRDAAQANLGAGAILQTLPMPQEGLFGSFDVRMAGSIRTMTQRFNARLASELVGPGNLLLDTAAIAETIGLSRWHDPMRWHDAKLPFALDAVPLYAEHLCRLLAAARGLSRKCLVLDLDETLWGGVIGDDGVEGIVLGQGSARGEAHLAIQSYALDLRSRGVLLAVCSKNVSDVALRAIREHDEMVLKEEHFAAFVANWSDKASNMRAIAEALDIGTDALVLLDDNPAERERVRQELPEVAVPEVGEEPADYVQLLSMAGYFEAVSFGEEDRDRAQMYRANALRTASKAQAGDLDGYLRSLEMTCTIRPFDDQGRARIAQLVNKSNQFNLTTRRYSEAEVAAIASDPAKYAIQVRLADRFGDNGMISVVIFDRGADEWCCDTWLMSCRVLGRRVEEAILAHIAEAAREAGVEKLLGTYLPTARNGLVADHFANLGFDAAGEGEGGTTFWSLDLASYGAPDLPMDVTA
ncbi:HAD-IIIC family phosphatase [Tsuneonella mangrovi]|uniref:HAD-IIIC family phosphatase n=1 Tax=Tsuneonella mangrovi TaxID=1982042 RepID=UPI000BA1F0F0|nr:HAD-IIIC family phosphatase [Tsuneonella mangrovi]